MSAHSTHPVSACLTADTAGVLPAEKPESAPEADSLARLYGWEFSVFAKEMWTDTINTTPWAESVALLRAGIRVRVWCTDSNGSPSRTTPLGPSRPIPAGTNRPARHELLLHPDGHITMLNHPDYTTPTGGHSAHLNHDTELFLHALGTGVPECAKTTLWLLGEQHDPAAAGPLAQTLGFAPASMWRTNYRLRSLYAAVAWAQQPVWPVSAWPRYLNAGTTPHVLAHWVESGWTVAEALTFLNRNARFEVAERWRAAGDTSARAARLAGRGETPDSEQPWIAAGFAPGESDRWRLFDNWQGPSVLTPGVAWHWHQHGVLPNSVRDFEALPATEAEAKQRPLPARGNRKPQPNPTLHRALEWTAAGVPSELVLAWYRTLGDDLPTTLAWCRKVPAMHYPKFGDWNAAHPECPVTAEKVEVLRRTGMPYDGELMARAAAAGLSVNDILRPVQMLTGAKRWLGIELRAVFTRAITEAVADEGNPQAKTWTRLAETVEAGEWERVANDLRNPHMASPLWGVLVDWLATRPTPPPHPRHQTPGA